MKITKTVEFPDDLVAYVARGIMANFPEASSGCALACTRYYYPEAAPLSRWRLEFQDEETHKVHMTRGRDFERVFPLLFTDKWPVGCPTAPLSSNQDDWDDWLCQCDATAFDAYAQLVCLGEVIYG
jgi:hypothetical protein